MSNRIAPFLPANKIIFGMCVFLLLVCPAAFGQTQRPSAADLIPFTNQWHSSNYKAPDLLSVLGCEATSWKTIQSATQPESLAGFNIAYDSARDRIVLFFGVDDTGSHLVSETWEWDGGNWSRISVLGPQPRLNQSMIYDASHDETILFGGQGYDEQQSFIRLMDDTWSWNGTNWSLKQPVNSPSPRAGQALAYRSLTGETILFGGDEVDSLDFVGPYLNDTWSWDGVNWTQQSPLLSPPARFRHNLAYDAHRDRVVLFGGQGESGILGDTWEWDGSTWTEINSPESPSPRRGFAMTYDSNRQKVVLFGGEIGIGFSYETWEFDGSSWNLIPAVNPPQTDSGAFTYDSFRKHCFLFTGEPPITNFFYDGKPNCTD